MALAFRAPVDCEPLVALAPDQAPEAVQAVVLLDGPGQDGELLPLAIVLGLAVKLTVGADVLTETIAVCVALPPVPVQVSE